MNIAGPSRAPGLGRRPRERVESTYEENLMGLLNQLSTDDMDELQTLFVRRASMGHQLSDHEIAMNDLLQQARTLAVFNEDMALAQRIAAGEDITDADRPPVRAPAIIPQPNINDRAATQRNVNPPRRAQILRRNPSQTWGLGKMITSVVGWVLGSNSASEPQPGPANATPAAPRPPVTNRPTGHDCVICQDPIHGVEIRAPCEHYYDIGCITDLFQSATRDESLYPPRCCRQPIPVALVRPHLSQALITTLQRKQAEFSTLKRVYCSSPTCSIFLGPLSEGMFANKVYTCTAPGCTRRTCGKCRGEHSGDWTHACRPDEDAAQVLELSRTSGWARCPGCAQMIELNLGCFHMTCRCRTEFCYLCQARWKTCQCPQWDERRLLAVAEERVDAQLGVPARARRVPPAPPARRVPPAPAPAPVPVRRPVENTVENRGAGAPARVARPAALTPAAALFPARTPVTPPAPGPRLRSILVNSTSTPQATASTSRSANTSNSARPKSILVNSTSTAPVAASTSRSASTSNAPKLKSILVNSTSTAPATASTSRSATTSNSARPKSILVNSTATAPAAASTSRSTSTSNASRPWSFLADSTFTAPATASTSRSATTSSNTTGMPNPWSYLVDPTPTTPAIASTSRSASTSTWRSELGSSSARPRPSSIAKSVSSHTTDDTNVDTMRQRMVREMMDRLRVDHDCDHGRWAYRRGGGICQTCGHHLPLYLFRCQGCEMLACNRCRRNRL